VQTFYLTNASQQSDANEIGDPRLAQPVARRRQDPI